jgi:ankyrin repeat protein
MMAGMPPKPKKASTPTRPASHTTSASPKASTPARSPASRPTSPPPAVVAKKSAHPKRKAAGAKSATVVPTLGGNARASATATKRLHEAAAKGDKDEVNKLLRANPDKIHSKNEEGKTALFLSAESGGFAVAKLLLSWGANVYTRGPEELTVLHAAAKSGNAKVLELLLIKGGMPVGLLDETGCTALHHAAFTGSEECCRILIEKGAAINAISSTRLTPLLAAASFGHEKVRPWSRHHVQ